MKFKWLKVFTVFSAVLFIACKTAKPRQPSSLDSALDLNEPLKLDNAHIEADGSLSTPLVWSPEERKANATFQYLVAQKYIVAGDIKQALPLLESSYSLDPNSYTGSQLVEAKLLTGNLEEAHQESHRMTLLYPKDDKLRLQYGQVLVFKNDLPGAELQFKKAIELNPKNEDAYVVLAKLMMSTKRPNEGIAIAQKLVKANPGTSKGWPLLTRLLVSQRKFREALDPAKRSWSLQPGQPEAAFLYGLVLDLNGKQKEAVGLYEQLYRLNPSSQDLVQRMVSLYQEMGNLEDALSLVDDMISRAKQSHPGLVMQRAIILSEMNRNIEASEVLEKLLSENPDSDRIQFMSAVALEKVGKIDEALHRYESIADESTVKLPGEYRRALILKQLNKSDESIALMEKLVKRTDADSMTWQLYIEILADLKKFDKARDAASTAAANFPDKIQLLFLKGVYEERTAQLTQAERTMRKVIQLNPEHAPALNFLGYMLAEQSRNLEEAESYIRKALKKKPGDGSYLDSLGWVFYQKKDFKKALETLKQAQEASPKEGVIIEHVGDTYLKLGDLNSALKSYEDALQAELDATEKTRVEKKLNEVKAKIK